MSSLHLSQESYIVTFRYYFHLFYSSALIFLAYIWQQNTSEICVLVSSTQDLKILCLIMQYTQRIIFLHSDSVHLFLPQILESVYICRYHRERSIAKISNAVYPQIHLCYGIHGLPDVPLVLFPYNISWKSLNFRVFLRKTPKRL